jgi:hypothetical protein
MSKSVNFVTAAAAAALISSAAFAADQPAQPNAAQQTAEKDFGRVSIDGFSAMHDVSMARWAIFNGDTNDAKQDLMNAISSLQKAQTDDSVFMKAESALKTPPGMTQPNPNHQQPNTVAVKWLPVDGAMAIGEDYTASPAKSAGVTKANQQLKQGDHAGAMDTLRLAGVDVTFDEAVAPLDQTIKGVSAAETLLDQGEFYEANQALKGVQDGIRYDIVDVTGAPKAHAGNGQATTHMASADDAKQNSSDQK